MHASSRCYMLRVPSAMDASGSQDTPVMSATAGVSAPLRLPLLPRDAASGVSCRPHGVPRHRAPLPPPRGLPITTALSALLRTPTCYRPPRPNRVRHPAGGQCPARTLSVANAMRSCKLPPTKGAHSVALRDVCTCYPERTAGAAHGAALSEYLLCLLPACDVSVCLDGRARWTRAPRGAPA